jgi:hypothetical protein
MQRFRGLLASRRRALEDAQLRARQLERECAAQRTQLHRAHQQLAAAKAQQGAALRASRGE